MSFIYQQISSLKVFLSTLIRRLSKKPTQWVRVFTLDFNWEMVKAALDKKLVFFIVALAVLYLSVGILGSVFTGTSEESILEETILDESALEGPVSLREPANITLGGSVIPGHILPAGTQLGIPHWIQQQYQMSNQKQFYNNSIMNFLMHNYGVVGPSASLDSKGLDTYYVPLSYRRDRDDDDDDDDDDDNFGTFMVDVTNLKQSKKEVQPLEVLEPAPEVVESSPKEEYTVPKQQAEQPTEQPADQQVAEQQPSPTEDSQVTLELTQALNTQNKNVPEVPEYKPEEDFSKDSTPTTCEAPNNKEEEKTEAMANCVECKNAEFHQSSMFGSAVLASFLDSVGNIVGEFSKRKSFSPVIKNFCNTCEPVDIKDFMQYIETRAKEEKTPPEIIFSLMMRESDGKCGAERKEKNNKGEVKGCSYGLFQLYTKNSTCLLKCDKNDSLSDMSSAQLKAVCQKGSQYARYREKCKNGKQYVSDGKTCNSLKPINETIKGIKNMKGMCLDNPYCNFEEALHLLAGEKWRTNEGKAKPELKSWPNMSREDRNLWRNAVIGYNGPWFKKKAEEAMKEAESQGQELDLDDWEQKRMFFVNRYLKESKKSRKDLLIHNLAYVEKITGREKEGGLANSSICQWLKFKKEKPSLSC